MIVFKYELNLLKVQEFRRIQQIHLLKNKISYLLSFGSPRQSYTNPHKIKNLSDKTDKFFYFRRIIQYGKKST